MKSDSDGVYTLLKHILKYKRLFWDGQPRVVDESGSQTQTNENENERQKRIELRRKIQKGALLSLLTFAIIWWRKKQKKSLSQYYSYLRPKALRGGVGPKKEDYHSAVEAPLSVLMLAAKKGMITKALINSNIIAYKIKESQDAATSSNSGLATITTKWKKSALPKDSPSVTKTIMNNITDGGCLDISVLPEPLLTRLIPIFATAFPFIYLFLLYHMMMRLQKGQSDSEDTGKSYSKEGPETTTFADVAGIDTAQVELQEIVSYLSNPKPYLGLGAAPPRGLLIHGKPGLGKTLLARAVAGEAQADHFISCSGSDFVEIYVGQGAKRVRNLFCSARQQAMKKWRKEHHGSGIGTFFKCMLPLSKRKISKQNDSMFDVNGHSCTRPPTAVLFIDEIDALAKCRGGIGYGASLGGTGGNDEREQTLNALLAEMDGFNRSNVLIIVIAATNRLSLLDPALMRPGRFDRHVALSPPTAEGRESIMKVHARKKKLDQDVDLHELADDKWTFDFSGAELKNVMNEAALLAVRDGSIAIGQNHLHLSTQRVKVMKRYATN